jgi:demethylmenaquinone methyltransferase/2-methoxy-6-polyprenyl-1,4-benzoquinol methylase
MTRSDHDRRIAEMFDRVAPRYRFLNAALSLGEDRGWRLRAARLARLGPRERALDVGTGTGDLAFEVLELSHPTASVLGVDISQRMLVAAADAARRRGRAQRFSVMIANALTLPFPSASFDRVIAGFTVRNFADRSLGLTEMRRVLRPAGRAVILELSTPPNALVRFGHRLYFHELAPRIAALLGGDAEAYRYLPRSVAAFPAADAFAEEMRRAGFARVRYERLSFGIAAIHVGEA